MFFPRRTIGKMIGGLHVLNMTRVNALTSPQLVFGLIFTAIGKGIVAAPIHQWRSAIIFVSAVPYALHL